MVKKAPLVVDRSQKKRAQAELAKDKQIKKEASALARKAAARARAEVKAIRASFVGGMYYDKRGEVLPRNFLSFADCREKTGQAPLCKRDVVAFKSHLGKKFRVLSNFAPQEITVDGIVYASVEHAFQGLFVFKNAAAAFSKDGFAGGWGPAGEELCNLFEENRRLQAMAPGCPSFPADKELPRHMLCGWVAKTVANNFECFGLERRDSPLKQKEKMAVLVWLMKKKFAPENKATHDVLMATGDKYLYEMSGFRCRDPEECLWEAKVEARSGDEGSVFSILGRNLCGRALMEAREALRALK